MLGFFSKFLEDYYESTENEIPLQIHHDISTVLIWIATGDLLDSIGEHCGPPAA